MKKYREHTAARTVLPSTSIKQDFVSTDGFPQTDERFPTDMRPLYANDFTSDLFLPSSFTRTNDTFSIVSITYDANHHLSAAYAFSSPIVTIVHLSSPSIPMFGLGKAAEGYAKREMV
ncbi:uncharacterized protein MONOS_15627 [Monocercomonoides exilis]|uniref:uncharacterized protein n=1 Tax=Monocercomonoides exilis TaxID=2049356 RepID=UPI00355A8F30|nr:hypothetical protein MONOS_15627 [Monocercomonoides exilis]|eukprot:MONOS_15627.1-p1 / transcript=MONOS_15627.1 / gene=MONOS_15627 / organism=Monocercomonoides_exilis_PA203 / gene_product=unspecified product / transcript_product=unspecified product / location=Mono_scaffold01291:5877-6230(-) / protein_length=118 / sequence_SO=supercontig / SO=protein_coding / is_pseudo=false